MTGMNFRGVLFFILFAIALLFAISSYISYRNGWKDATEVKTKKPIVPTLIIEKSGNKIDTTYIYKFPK